MVALRRRHTERFARLNRTLRLAISHATTRAQHIAATRQARGCNTPHHDEGEVAEVVVVAVVSAPHQNRAALAITTSHATTTRAQQNISELHVLRNDSLTLIAAHVT